MTLTSEKIQIYLMYFNNTKGIIPILIYPDDSIRNNLNAIRPVKFHPIWFVEEPNYEDCKCMDFVYKEKIYYGKRFKIGSNQEKKDDDKDDFIALIIALPKEFQEHGLKLFKIFSDLINNDFEERLWEIIKSGLLKANWEKIPNFKQVMIRYDFIKEKVKILIRKIWDNYFLSIKENYGINE